MSDDKRPTKKRKIEVEQTSVQSGKYVFNGRVFGSVIGDNATIVSTGRPRSTVIIQDSSSSDDSSSDDSSSSSSSSSSSDQQFSVNSNHGTVIGSMGGKNVQNVFSAQGKGISIQGGDIGNVGGHRNTSSVVFTNQGPVFGGLVGQNFGVNFGATGSGASAVFVQSSKKKSSGTSKEPSKEPVVDLTLEKGNVTLSGTKTDGTPADIPIAKSLKIIVDGEELPFRLNPEQPIRLVPQTDTVIQSCAVGNNLTIDGTIFSPNGKISTGNNLTVQGNINHADTVTIGNNADIGGSVQAKNMTSRIANVKFQTNHF